MFLKKEKKKTRKRLYILCLHGLSSLDTFVITSIRLYEKIKNSYKSMVAIIPRESQKG